MEFIIFFIPAVFLLAAKYWLPKTITILEVLIGVVVLSVSAFLFYHIGVFSEIVDKEIWNGKIVRKVKGHVSCEHKYSCRCSGGIETCSTCYEHYYDVDWRLDTTIGEIDIDRIDSQGITEPPLWKKAWVQEPVSKVKRYENYMQAVPSSLFNENDFIIEDRFKDLIPVYPITIYNKYHYNHLVEVDVIVADVQNWNKMLAEMLKDLGPRKQVNVLVVIVNTKDPAYIHSLEKAWLRGNKNDAIVVVGSTDYPNIDWVDIMSWTPSELFKVKLRDDIKALGKLYPELVIPVIKKHVSESFVRMEMSDYDHLLNEAEPPEDYIYWVWLFLIASALFYIFLAHKYDAMKVAKWPLIFLLVFFLAFLFGYLYVEFGELALLLIPVYLFLYYVLRFIFTGELVFTNRKRHKESG